MGRMAARDSGGSPPVNVGLIGCGRAAERLHLPALASLSEARLVAVADPILERRKLISSRIPQCLAFSTAETLMQEAEVAAVIIATPPTSHVDLVTLAVRSSFSVLVEKPLATSMRGVRSLEKLVASSGGVVMVGFNRRQMDSVRKLRQIMRSKHHSDPASAQIVLKTNMKAWAPVSEARDPLEDLGPHEFDLLRFIFGREISAISARWSSSQEIQMQVKLDGGVVADCIAAHTDFHEESIIVQCEEQRYKICGDAKRIEPASALIRLALGISDKFKDRLRSHQSSLSKSYEQQLISFLSYVHSGATPQPSIVDGIAAIHAVEAARKSANNDGVEVLVPK